MRASRHNYSGLVLNSYLIFPFSVIFFRPLHPTKQKAIMSKQDTYSTTLLHREEAEKDFDAMLLRNKAMLWHVCSDYSLGREWSMEDRMQEVMASLWRSFDQFEGRSSEKTWVWRVATNTMLQLRRKADRTIVTETLENDMEADTEPADENLRQLNQLIDILPEKDATAIRAFLDGFSYKEIADMTNSTIGAVAMRIARTKRRLKQMYDEENNTTKKYER